MTETLPREWTLRIPLPCPWLTLNIERDKYRRAGLVKKWRKAVVTVAEMLELPHGITPVRIFVRFHYTSRQAPVRDRHNLSPTIKALVDGLGPSRTFTVKGKTYTTDGYGLIPDDSDRHVLDTKWEVRKSTWSGAEIIVSPARTAAEQIPLFR